MLNDSVVILQSALIATTLSSISSLGTGRPRPFVYDGPDPDEDAPEHVKDSAEGALSFFSGHTAFAFALSTSTFWTVKRRHRRSAYPWIVLGAGTAVAATVATGRIMGGMHFPTDVAGGAIVGSSIGTLVPMLHGTPVIAAPVAGRDRAGVVVHGVF
jgi:undecaprenyl-diphosphatase